MTHQVPAPPDGALPEVTLRAEATLFRVHQAQFPAASFNPGGGSPTRFAFFHDAEGLPVPVWYGGESQSVAVFESIFHDTVPGAVVRPDQWRTRVLSAVQTTRSLRLAHFHSEGLRQLGLYARDLTDTPPTAYRATVAWARAAYLQGLDGCVWMSRQFNSEQAFVLFGGRAADNGGMTENHQVPRRVFALPHDEAWLAEQAERIGVTLLLT